MEDVTSYLQKYMSRKNKDLNDKVCNMITNKNEAKAMARHISHDCKCNFTSTTYNSNQKWNKKHVNVNVKIIASAKKIIVGILTYVFVKIAIT